MKPIFFLRLTNTINQLLILGQIMGVFTNTLLALVGLVFCGALCDNYFGR